jgi:hypothetical protein
MDPAMMGAPPAGMPPMDPAMMAQMPPEGIASLPMDQGAMPPMQMARGGIVQYFQEGGSAEAVADPDSRRRLPPSPMAQQYIEDLLSPMAAQPRVDLMARTRELTPNYQELLGTTDRGATQAQMLFDIAQAALGYASNVGPDGQPLSGSQAARLAGATRALPGQIGARAAAMKDDETRARMAALQQAQSERSSMDERDLAREDARQRLLLEYAKQNVDTDANLVSTEEAARLGLDPNQRWQVKNGAYSIAGGRDLSIAQTATPLIEAEAAKAEQAQKALNNIGRIDSTIRIIQEGEPITGLGAEIRLNIERGIGLFAGMSPERLERISDTELLEAALGQDVFGAITALGVGARGLDTPAERIFLQRVLAGNIGLTRDTLLGMAQLRRTVEANALRDYNARLNSESYKALMAVNPIPGLMRTEPLTIPRTPLERSYVPGADYLTAEDRMDIEAELARLTAESERRSNRQGGN